MNRRTYSKLFALLLVVGSFNSFARGPSLTLPELEAMLDTSRHVELATAEIEERLYLLKRERQRRGLKLFANGGYADVSEVVTDDLKRNYQRQYLTLGLSYPLFGTNAAERAAIVEAEYGVTASEMQRRSLRSKALATLRRSYIDYWISHRRLSTSREFLQSEPETHHWLTERTASGYLLEADRLEFMSGFDLARRAVASDEELMDRTHGTMALLTKDSLPKFLPESPALSEICLDKEELLHKAIELDPQLQRLKYRKATLRQLKNSASEIEGNLNLSTTVGRDEPSSLNDSGLALSFNVRMPLEFLGARHNMKAARNARLHQVNLEIDRRRYELANEIDSAVNRYRTAVENLSFAETRFAAALESVRERQLKAARLPGDRLEQLQQARFSSYRTAIDLIDSESLLLKSKVDILHYSAHRCGSAEKPSTPTRDAAPLITAALPSNGVENTKSWASTLNLRPLKSRPVLRANAAAAPHLDHPIDTKRSARVSYGVLPSRAVKHTRVRFATPTPDNSDSTVLGPQAAAPERTSNIGIHNNSFRRGVYLWRSRKLLSSKDKREEFLHLAGNYGINRVLLSLDGYQLKQIGVERQHQQILSFVKAADALGISVELLLGEHSWLLPRHRSKLLEIVRQVQALPFKGLHLDIEPSAFDEEFFDRAKILENLADTVDEVQQVNALPLSLSLHFRDLSENAPYCLGCRLSKDKLAEVILMIYVSNPERTQEIAKQVAANYPDLRFSVAQSVEPILDATESHATVDLATINRRLEHLQQSLEPRQFNSIVLQSWSDLREVRR